MQTNRLVALMDLDCFYAQAAMLLEPKLTEGPLAITQKLICVTTNYSARQHGVGKLSMIHEAIKSVPLLRLRSGEDLFWFRKASQSVVACCRSFLGTHAAIQRVGLDEFFFELPVKDTSKARTTSNVLVWPGLLQTTVADRDTVLGEASVDMEDCLRRVLATSSSDIDFIRPREKLSLSAHAGQLQAVGLESSTAADVLSKSVSTAAVTSLVQLIKDSTCRFQPAFKPEDASSGARGLPSSSSSVPHTPAAPSSADAPKPFAPLVESGSEVGGQTWGLRGQERGMPRGTSEQATGSMNAAHPPAIEQPAATAGIRRTTPSTPVPAEAEKKRMHRQLHLTVRRCTSPPGSPDHATETQLCALAWAMAALRWRVRRETGFTTCAGIGCSRLAAKLAAGLRKPNRQSAVLPSALRPMIRPLPVRALPGIGHSTAALLEQAGVRSVADVEARLVAVRGGRAGPLEVHQSDSVAAACRALRLGEGGFAARQALLVSRLCCGVDDSPVVPMEPPKQLSDEDSFKELQVPAAMRAKLEGLCRGVLSRLLEDGRVPRLARLQVLRGNRKRISKSCRVPAAVLQCLRAHLSRDEAAEALDGAASSSSGEAAGRPGVPLNPSPAAASGAYAAAETGPFGAIQPVRPVPGQAPSWGVGQKPIASARSVAALARACWLLLCTLVPELARRNISFDMAVHAPSSSSSGGSSSSGSGSGSSGGSGAMVGGARSSLSTQPIKLEPPIIVLNVALLDFAPSVGPAPGGVTSSVTGSMDAWLGSGSARAPAETTEATTDQTAGGAGKKSWTNCGDDAASSLRLGQKRSRPSGGRSSVAHEPQGDSKGPPPAAAMPALTEIGFDASSSDSEVEEVYLSSSIKHPDGSKAQVELLSSSSSSSSTKRAHRQPQAEPCTPHSPRSVGDVLMQGRKASRKRARTGLGLVGVRSAGQLQGNRLRAVRQKPGPSKARQAEGGQARRNGKRSTRGSVGLAGFVAREMLE